MRFIVLLPASLLAQPVAVKFEQIIKTEGLSHTRIQCILQDKQGYIWFGTVRD
jgi:ligand-binding sensor domain-containing protein